MGIETFQNHAPHAAEQDLTIPGSFQVSTMLMEDSVPAGAVSVRLGRNQKALFSNPFKEGVVEALVIEGDRGHLTYLERSGDSTTGWRQNEVTSAPLDEVVIAEHPDGSLWAFGATPAGSQPWDIRKLEVVQRNPDGTVVCAWIVTQAFQNPPDRGDSLNVSYAPDSGATILGGYGVGDTRYALAIYPDLPVSGSSAPYFPWGYVTSETTLGGDARVVGGGYFSAASRSKDSFARYVAYYIFGSNMLARLEFGTGPDWGTSVSAPMSDFCGTWFVPALPQKSKCSDVGCVYLDTQGNLCTFYRKWETDTHVQTSTKLGFGSSQTWQDADGDLHVFGVDDTDTLQVLHQHSWQLTPDGQLQIQWAQATASDGTTTLAVIGLAAHVDEFLLDPYPDYEPTQLIRLRGVAAEESVSLYAQDVTSSRWSVEAVRLPSSGLPHVVNRYTADATLLNKYGWPMTDHPVRVSADTLVEVQINTVSYQVGPGKTAEVRTSPGGMLTVSIPADGLVCPVVLLNADGLQSAAAIDFDSHVNDYLAGKGKLPSQDGLFDAAQLQNAQCTDTDGNVTPLVADWDTAPMDPETAVQHCSTMYAMAAGDQQLPKFVIDGYDEPQDVAGYVLQVWDPSRPAFQAFRTAEELDAYRSYRDTHPSYGGILDDFEQWRSDIWQGLKSGATKVAEFLVDTAVEILVYVGDKVLSIGRWIISSVEEAAQAVEALFQYIAEEAVRAIDWLKALFGLKDIWDTKTALENCGSQLIPYLSTTLTHYKDLGPQWFESQKAKVTQWLLDLEARYKEARMGDWAYDAPTVPDSSGGTLDQQDLNNPQTAWLTNKCLANDAGTGLDPVNDPELESEFTTFVENLFDSKEVQTIIDAWNKVSDLLTDIFDTSSSDQTGRSPSAPAIEGIRKVAGVLIDAVATLYQWVMDFLIMATKSVNELLFQTKVDFGYINTLYDWIQKKAYPDKPSEDMTLGGLVFLLMSFYTTPTYKLVMGVDNPPFPDGKFPDIPPPTWGPSVNGVQDPVDPEFNLAMLKIQCSQIGSGIVNGVFGGLTDFIGPFSGKIPTWGNPGLIAVRCGHIAGGIWSFIVGTPCVGSGGKWDSALAYVSWIPSGIGWVLDAFFTAFGHKLEIIGKRSSVLKNASRAADTVNKIYDGSCVQGALAGLSIAASVGGAASLPDSTPPGRVGMAWTGAFLGGMPKVLQVSRIYVDDKIPGPKQLKYLLGVSILDGSLGLINGIMAGGFACHELRFLPQITNAGNSITVTANKAFEMHLVDATGGDMSINSPLAYEVTAGKPGDLLFVSGKPGTVASSTGLPKDEYTFTVQVQDNWGPKQAAQATFTIIAQ
ncbi:hypothetical protein [Streptomyces chartreusis]|uniref:hypothetical protein n=1 Tax=Streptomyces chartreusis TaxID=1969 RepID=UPI00365868A2